MQIKQIYVCSISGKEFDKVEDCLKHESMMADIEAELYFLKSYVDDRKKTGTSYRLPRGTVERIQRALCILLPRYEKEIFDSRRICHFSEIHGGSILHRILEDSNSVFSHYFFILNCICEKCDTLYDQPYNAAHCSCTRLKQEELK